MNVYTFGKTIEKEDVIFFQQGSILLLGEFEFFHVGHNTLLEEAKKQKKDEEKIGIFILYNKQEKIVQSLEDRLYNLSLIGFDFVVIAEFNYEFKTIDGEDFINSIESNYNVKTFVVGQDFYFGKNRKYNSLDLQKTLNKNTIICKIHKYKENKVSSREIKQMYEFGEINIIKNILINPLTITINIVDKKIIWDEKLLKPHFGIYFCKLLVDSYWYHGIVHFSMENNINFHLINIEEEKVIFNQKSKIVLLDVERIIINKRYDQINNDDKKISLNFFKVE